MVNFAPHPSPNITSQVTPMDIRVLELEFGLILVKTYIKEIKNTQFPNL
jgi:hypothetical protein